MPTISADIIEVVVFRKGTGGTEYLVLQRAEHERLYPGIWQIVSGKIKGNETAAQAALREVREETGLHLRGFWSLPVVNAFHSVESDVVHVTPMFAAEVKLPDVPTLSKEHQSWKWISQTDAKSVVLWPGTHHALEVCEAYILGRPDVGRLLRIE